MVISITFHRKYLKNNGGIEIMNKKDILLEATVSLVMMVAIGLVTAILIMLV